MSEHNCVEEKKTLFKKDVLIMSIWKYLNDEGEKKDQKLLCCSVVLTHIQYVAFAAIFSNRSGRQ